jgi:CRISPR-associated protein Cmr3
MTDAAIGCWRGFAVVPEDVLFFRDSKPSSMELDHYLRSIFPPLPSTLYGMVRTTRLCDYGIDLTNLDASHWRDLPAELRAEIGEWGETGSIRLRGPWLVRTGQTPGTSPEILLPAPGDLGLVFPAHGAKPNARPLEVIRYRAADADRIAGNWSHSLKLVRPYSRSATGQWSDFRRPEDVGEPQSPENWFVTPPGMDRWLEGGVPLPEQLIPVSELWSVERRIGVGLQKSERTSKDGRLYSFGYIRLERDVTLGLEVAGCKLEPSRIAWLGGEGRVARLEKGPSLSERFPASDATSPAALYLATPAVFSGDIASEPAIPKTVAAVVRSAIDIGGWDVANQRPKALRRGVPAGSIYHVASSDSVSSYLPISEHHEQGFGVALAGSV